ncbi:MAG: response regulator, partial [Pseudomonadota bacterium]
MTTSFLIVEPNSAFAGSLTDTLSKRYPSATIEVAPTGAACVEKLETAHPEIFFVDVRLPDTNGFHLCRRIKKAFPRSKVILSANCDLPEYREAARS